MIVYIYFLNNLILFIYSKYRNKLIFYILLSFHLLSLDYIIASLILKSDFKISVVTSGSGVVGGKIISVLFTDLGFSTSNEPLTMTIVQTSSSSLTSPKSFILLIGSISKELL